MIHYLKKDFYATQKLGFVLILTLLLIIFTDLLLQFLYYFNISWGNSFSFISGQSEKEKNLVINIKKIEHLKSKIYYLNLFCCLSLFFLRIFTMWKQRLNGLIQKERFHLDTNICLHHTKQLALFLITTIAKFK